MAEELRAYMIPDTSVVEGFSPMTEPYQRLLGIVTRDQTVWDERSVSDDLYRSPHNNISSRSPDLLLMPPPEAGEHMRLRRSTLEPEAVTEEDKRIAEQAFSDILTLIPQETPFTELTTSLRKGNLLAARPATYEEALYALELARLTTAETFQHRIACYELSLTAARYCHLKKLSVDWCIGVSLLDEAPHAWLEVDDRPVRGEADEIITGVYQKLLQV